VLLAFYPANWSEASRLSSPSFRRTASNCVPANASRCCVRDSIRTRLRGSAKSPAGFSHVRRLLATWKACALFGALREQEPMRGAGDRVIYLITGQGRSCFDSLWVGRTSQFTALLEVLGNLS